MGIGFVGGIPHGDQGWVDQPQALLQHIAAGWGFGATNEAPGKPCVVEGVEEFWRHQQGFVADEALPAGGIAMGVAAEVGLTENRDNLIKSRQGGAGASAPQQFEGGFPVVVPKAFALEEIDFSGCGAITAVVINGFTEGAAVTAANIPNDAINVEENQGAGTQGQLAAGLID